MEYPESSAEEPPRPHVVALMGSYRDGGAIDEAIAVILEGAREEGARTDVIRLKDMDVEFCTNCRVCTHTPGLARGTCLIHDDQDQILRSLDGADAIVLGAPVNFGDVNALTRRLLERMVGYAYWPEGAKAPALRDEATNKPAVLVSASAAPAIMTRTLMKPIRTLKQMAKLLHARPTGTLVLGFAGAGRGLTKRQIKRARRLGWRLSHQAAKHPARPKHIAAL